MEKTRNIYDHLIICMIALLAFGNVGGALQPIRIFFISCIPFTLIYFLIRPIERKKIQYEKFFFLFWALWAVVSLLWVENTDNSIKSLLYLSVNFSILFTIIYLSNKANNPQESIIWGWTLLLLLTFPIAIFELLFNIHLPSIYHDSQMEMHYDTIINRSFASVTFGNLNGYNVVLCYVFPFVLGAIAHKQLFKKKTTLFITLTSLVALLIIWNGSRAAALSLITGLLLFYIYYPRGKGHTGMPIITISLVIGAIFFLVFKDTFQVILVRFQEQGFEDTGRIENITSGFDALINSSLLGVGVGNYETIMEEKYRLTYINPHNMLLEIAVQYGIFVFLGFLIFLFRILRRAQNNIKENKALIFVGLGILPFAMIIDSAYLLSSSMWVFLSSLYIFSAARYNTTEEHVGI